MKKSAFSKRLAVLVLTAAVLFSSLLVLASCGKEKEVTIGLIPVYIGPDVYTTDHEFHIEDFQLIASYADGRDEYPDDFEFEMTGLESGYYCFLFSYGGLETEGFVRCKVPVFPSDSAGSGAEENP